MRINPDKNPWYVIGFAAIVSGLFTMAIMALHVASEPIVQANQRLLTERAIVELFGLDEGRELTDAEVTGLIDARVAGLGEPISLETDGESVRILIAYESQKPAEIDPLDKTGVLAYAFPIRGVGFWAMIDGWLAVTPNGTRAVGVVFLSHQETPGLGGRITEKAFRSQFKGLTVTPPPPGMQYVYIGRTAPEPASPQAARHVDAITGATGTSTAVETFVNDDLARFRRIATAAGLLEDNAATDAPQR